LSSSICTSRPNERTRADLPDRLPAPRPALAGGRENYVDAALHGGKLRQPGVVWSTIGATSPPTSEKSGHNNNLPVIVTGDCVDVVNAGDNDLLARALHE
jgi:hypothetical protein